MPSAFGGGVHLADERVDGSRDVLREGDGRIVAGLDQEPAQQILDTDLGVDFDEHARAAHAPRPLADARAVVEPNAAGLQSAEHDIGRHELREARRRKLVVGGARGEHLARREVDEVVALGAELRRRGQRDGGRLRPERRGYRARAGACASSCAATSSARPKHTARANVRKKLMARCPRRAARPPCRSSAGACRSRRTRPSRGRAPTRRGACGAPRSAR